MAGEPPHGTPLLYERHMYYVDVERYLGDGNSTIPNWFNFVRHPIRRIESDFYYRRSDDRWRNINSNLPNKGLNEVNIGFS